MESVGFKEWAIVCEALGRGEVLEGDWQPKRIVILEFESMERAKKWLNSEEYRAPRQIRHRTAKTNMILVDGV